MADARPLLTFALFAYKQERYIAEAVRAALAQTYSPLEIIISDDCSPDRTYEVILEETKDYRGPHKIVVQRTSRNLGLCGHVNQIARQAAGELLVAAAGDDISLPHRTETVWREWERLGRKPSCLYSAYRLTDEEGNDLGSWETIVPKCDDLLEQCRRGLVISGCANAWQREVFEEFGPLREDLTFEDCAVALRSKLLGGIHYIPEELLRYRRVSGGLTFHTTEGSPAENRRREILLHARRTLILYQQWEADFRKAKNSPHGWEAMIEELRWKQQYQIDLIERSFFGRFLSFILAWRQGLSRRWVLKLYVMYASRFAFAVWVRRNRKMRESVWERVISAKKAQQA